MTAREMADKIEALDDAAFAWLLSLEFTHDSEAADAKALIIRALRELKE